MKLVLIAAAPAAPVRQTAAPVSGGASASASASERAVTPFAGAPQPDPLGARISAPAPFDTARIGLIRSALDSGRYSADPAAIARAMIASPELVGGAAE